MHLEDYTSENICRWLGLAAFADDAALLSGEGALRLLLLPSFHPEACLTLFRTDNGARVSVVSARAMIWDAAAPLETLTDRDEGNLSSDQYDHLASDFMHLAKRHSQRGAVLDGMTADILLLRKGTLVARFQGNVSGKSPLGPLVARAIKDAWDCIPSPRCRNAIATTGKYVGLDLAKFEEPELKPTVRTVVLGSEEDRKQVLRALKKRHES